ncbi:hypothetical protein Maq22A_c22770 [Methylobacterium aquaticum]|uniref:Uncharacterized protein n=1 Tax=Methylobacterium aquaticum TaxID=270351 RepID=A0A0C6F4B8_9HYPH|nr:hypothetical protein Maq22A_c22770 [Methylobacterium aquaticum]
MMVSCAATGVVPRSAAAAASAGTKMCRATVPVIVTATRSGSDAWADGLGECVILLSVRSKLSKDGKAHL